jgi:hypothetical protein
MLLPELGFIQNGSLFKENAQPSHRPLGRGSSYHLHPKKV